MRAALLTALVLSIPAASVAVPQRGVLPWTDPRPQARGAALLRSAMIAGHNQARRQYGVSPLLWDEGLARDAAVYAARLARTNRFEHDRQAGRFPRQGENLFMGTRGAYSYADMIRLLVDERRYFRPGRFPNVSRTGSVWHVGHYTQIIWPSSQRVGCATASNRSNDYLVCRYLPAGNIVGTVLR
ncbi:MAG: CAP domain-containing protein [Pseudomonadota bacterium]|nr:CAP domain-containing protein [Pseudomonadota bacterium]